MCHAAGTQWKHRCECWNRKCDVWNDCLNGFWHLVCGMGATGLTETRRAPSDAVESQLRQVSAREVSLKVVGLVAPNQWRVRAAITLGQTDPAPRWRALQPHPHPHPMEMVLVTYQAVRQWGDNGSLLRFKQSVPKWLDRSNGALKLIFWIHSRRGSRLDSCAACKCCYKMSKPVFHQPPQKPEPCKAFAKAANKQIKNQEHHTLIHRSWVKEQVSLCSMNHTSCRKSVWTAHLHTKWKKMWQDMKMVTTWIDLCYDGSPWRTMTMIIRQNI